FMRVNWSARTPQAPCTSVIGTISMRSRPGALACAEYGLTAMAGSPLSICRRSSAAFTSCRGSLDLLAGKGTDLLRSWIESYPNPARPSRVAIGHAASYCMARNELHRKGTIRDNFVLQRYFAAARMRGMVAIRNAGVCFWIWIGVAFSLGFILGAVTTV